jgi:hypothetical protein
MLSRFHSVAPQNMNDKTYVPASNVECRDVTPKPQTSLTIGSPIQGSGFVILVPQRVALGWYGTTLRA